MAQLIPSQTLQVIICSASRALSASVRHSLTADQRLAMFTPESPESFRQQPTNSGSIPSHVREQLSKSLYQPSW